MQQVSPASGRLGGPRTLVWLLRHPEVHADWRDRAYGSLDAPLGESGLRAAEEVGAWYAQLAPARVVSSPLSRARVLAERIAAGARVELECDARLRELDRGRWQGRVRAELEASEPELVRAYHEDPWNWRGHGGETDADIHARARPVLDALVESSDEPLGERIAGRLDARRVEPRDASREAQAPRILVAHYNVVRVLCASVLGMAPARSFALRLDPARAMLLAHARDGWALVRANVQDPRAHAAPLARALPQARREA